MSVQDGFLPGSNVSTALKTLASTLDLYDPGDGDAVGPDVDAIALRTDALGKLAAMLSEIASPLIDDSSAHASSFDWGCCQTASITTKIAKLASAPSQQSILSPMRSRANGPLWWISTDDRAPWHILEVAHYAPATQTEQAELLLREARGVSDAACGELGFVPDRDQASSQVPAIHVVTDTGTVILGWSTRDCLIVCDASGVGCPDEFAGSGQQSVCSLDSQPTRPPTKLTISSKPDLPVFASNTTLPCSGPQSYSKPSQDNGAGQQAGAGAVPPDSNANLSCAEPPDSEMATRDESTAGAHAAMAWPTSAACSGGISLMDSGGPSQDFTQCMMHMHGVVDAATCRLDLGDGWRADIVFGAGSFMHDQTPQAHPPGPQRAGALQPAGRAESDDRLPAVLCWVLLCCASGAADGRVGLSGASEGTDAACALVDTAADTHGTVTSVDVMAAGAGQAVVAFVTSDGRLLMWRLAFGATPDSATGADCPGSPSAAAAAVTCNCCELLAEGPALPPGATVAHHALPLLHEHAAHAVVWVAQHGALQLRLYKAAEAHQRAARKAECSAMRQHAARAVPCADLGAVTAVAAGGGFIVLGAETGAVAVWRVGSGRDAPMRVGGWCLEGQSVSAVMLAVREEGLQVLVAMESGDVFNFDTGL
eukprot:jgi/Ulvmu1/8839/UM049_0019.1